MIRISSHEQRLKFSEEQIQEVLPAIQRLTAQAYEQSLEATSVYGHVREDEPERDILKHALAKIIQDWSAKIRRLGAEPLEMWSVHLYGEQGVLHWQYSPEPK